MVLTGSILPLITHLNSSVFGSISMVIIWPRCSIVWSVPWKVSHYLSKGSNEHAQRHQWVGKSSLLLSSLKLFKFSIRVCLELLGLITSLKAILIFVFFFGLNYVLAFHYLTDKMKRNFFQAAVMSILLYGCTTWRLTKRLEEKLDKNAARNIEQGLEATSHKAPTIRQLTSHHENNPS